MHVRRKVFFVFYCSFCYCSLSVIFRSTSGHLQSKNLQSFFPARLDLQSDRNEYKHF